MFHTLINPRRACAARVTVVVVSVCLSVCLCVCVSVKSHLTFGASVRPENAVTYSVGNKGQKICGVFSDTASFQSYGTCCIVYTAAVQSAIFLSAKYTRALLKCHVDSGAEFGQVRDAIISFPCVLAHPSEVGAY